MTDYFQPTEPKTVTYLIRISSKLEVAQRYAAAVRQRNERMRVRKVAK